MNIRSMLYFWGVLPLLAHGADWKPVEGQMMTRWARQVNPAAPLPEYPRPQMVRDDWTNLNGLWDFRLEPAATGNYQALVETAQRGPQIWRWTREQPGEGWNAPAFADQEWAEGQAGFGSQNPPGSIQKTEWNTPDIWLRKDFDLQEIVDRPLILRIHHDEDVEVYLNGTPIFSGTGWLVQYETRALDSSANQALRKGRNTLAVHCHQKGGGQYIDVGLYQYAGQKEKRYTQKILVPFPVESALSGVKTAVQPGDVLVYQRRFSWAPAWKGQRVLLHFGAVDWSAQVYVNDQWVASHTGGFDPFSADITEALKPGEEQVVRVEVTDPNSNSFIPRGKQILNPHGIWYTAVSGIWQTVWLEPVAPTFVRGLKMTPDLGAHSLILSVDAAHVQAGDQVVAEARFAGDEVAQVSGEAGKPLVLPIPQPKLWAPDHPHLYDLSVAILRNGKKVDTVKSYFGMRSMAVQKDAQGINRLFLNGKPLFQYGPLDQGWWPDGLYTAPTDEALVSDILLTKEMGFNMIRKHVKVEPARWYAHCDRLGMLVWQDMPSGDQGIGQGAPDFVRSPESALNYRKELKAMMDTLHNAPCIVMWVPFNEGWGQFDTAAVTDWVAAYDPSRLVNQASGWTDRNGGSVHDVHIYPGPGMPPLEEKRAAVLGEFGGLGWPVENHLWWNKRNWGYRTYGSKAELQDNYQQLIEKLVPLVKQGLAAAVYTQTTDVEGEVNGLMTYDRAVLKFDRKALFEMHQKLYE